MPISLAYLLVPVSAIILISAQALWRTAVVNDKVLEGSISTIIIQSVSNPKIWLGIILYIFTTALYLFVLNKLKFFTVQLTITGLALIFSTFLSYFVFHEKITILNLLGLGIILIGIFFVIQK